VKLLFDQNLSRHLVRRLATQFPDSQHVAAVGLDVATDRDVWDYAAANQHVIVSEDSDFRQLAFLLGPPPKAIWLKIGNQPTSAIAALLSGNVDAIESFVADPESALLVLPDLGR
jgi:predicted nuclease of predicted toxin-antitoxin system